MKKLKIAIFLPTLEVGGAEKSAVHLANAFVKRGFIVDLLVVNAATKPQAADISEMVNLIDFGKTHVILSMLQLISYLRNKRPDFLLGIMDHSNVVALLANFFAVRNATRIIITAHAHSSSRSDYAYNIKSKIVLLLAKYLYRKACAMVAVSHSVANQVVRLLKLPNSFVRVIYNPFDREKISDLANKKLEYSCFPNNLDGNKLILAVGRLEAVKDFATLIKAFAILVQTMSETCLIILGEGSLRDDLQLLISHLNLNDKVFLLGYSNNPYYFMKRCDLFVLSSLSESFSYVLLEALFLAPRVIATDCPGGVREILNNGGYGKLVRTRDHEALAHTMIALLHEAPIEVEPTFFDRFDEQTIVDQYLRIFCEFNCG